MSFYITIALLNGFLITTSRALNGQLAIKINAFQASFLNHIVGFLFLSLIITFLGEWSTILTTQLSFTAFIGGTCGALFVALSSYIFPKLGAMKSAILIITGQMISALIIDWLYHFTSPNLVQYLGVLLVLMGVFFSKKSSANTSGKPQ